MPTSYQGSIGRGLAAQFLENQRLVGQAMARTMAAPKVEIPKTLISPTQSQLAVQRGLESQRRLFGAQTRLADSQHRLFEANQRIGDLNKGLAPIGAVEATGIRPVQSNIGSLMGASLISNVNGALARVLDIANRPLVRTALEKAYELQRQAMQVGRDFERRFVILTRSALRNGRSWIAACWQRMGYIVDVNFDDRSALGEDRARASRAEEQCPGDEPHAGRDPGGQPVPSRKRAERLLLRASRGAGCGGRHRWPTSSHCSTSCRGFRRGSKSLPTRRRSSTSSSSSRLWPASLVRSWASSSLSTGACALTTGSATSV